MKVIAPGGRTIDSPTGDGVAGGTQLMIIRFDRMQITSVGMRHGIPGIYRIVALPGSPPISQIATATPLPDATITAAVHGRGTHRVLSYDIAPRSGQQVRFLEVTASGAARTIATITRAGRGSLPFTTAPGTGIRSIVAQCELARLPAERITVAHFRPPSPRLGRIRALRVVRRGTTIRARWDSVFGASGYEIVLTSDGSSQRRVQRPRHGGYAERRRRLDRRPRQRPCRRHASGRPHRERRLQSDNESPHTREPTAEGPTASLRTRPRTGVAPAVADLAKPETDDQHR